MPAGASARPLDSLTNIATRILTHPLFSSHAAAVCGDPSLQRSLVQLLVAALHQTAVAAQLPPERQPEWFSWPKVQSLCCALSSQPLRAALSKEHLAPPVGGGCSPSALLVLQSAAQVVAAITASCPAGMTGSSHMQLYCQSMLQLSIVCRALSRGIEQPSGSPPPLPTAQRQRALRALLHAATQMHHPLRLVCGRSAAASGAWAGHQLNGRGRSHPVRLLQLHPRFLRSAGWSAPWSA